jgi:proline iminopeptidase
LAVGTPTIPDDTSLWTLERYTEEVEEVRRGLGLENFVLYGQSWGGMLAIEYALRGSGANNFSGQNEVLEKD